jgi:hypothetical protein
MATLEIKRKPNNCTAAMNSLIEVMFGSSKQVFVSAERRSK